MALMRLMRRQTRQRLLLLMRWLRVMLLLLLLMLAEMRCMLGHRLAIIRFRHALDSPTPQPRILMRIAPTVDRPLDEPPLAPETRVELCQRPSDGVALCLVDEPVAAVLVLGAAGARVDAVLSLEVLRQGLDVNVLDVAADGVLHLDAVAGVLEGDPLDAVCVLPDDERRGCWDGPRSSAGVCRGRGGCLRPALEFHARADLGRALGVLLVLLVWMLLLVLLMLLMLLLLMLLLMLLLVLLLLVMLVWREGAHGRVLGVGSGGGVHAEGWRLGVERAAMLVLLGDGGGRMVDGRVGPLHVRRCHNERLESRRERQSEREREREKERAIEVVRWTAGYRDGRRGRAYKDGEKKSKRRSRRESRLRGEEGSEVKRGSTRAPKI